MWTYGIFSEYNSILALHCYTHAHIIPKRFIYRYLLYWPFFIVSILEGKFSTSNEFDEK